MAIRNSAPPLTMVSPDTNETLVRSVRPFAVSYKGETITVDLPGYYPAGDGDGVHLGDDMAAVDVALRLLKSRIDGLPTPESIRSIRQRLKLSQRQAGALFRVGENAFDKYERGMIAPSGPTIQLLKLLDRHPELVSDLAT
jgi:HTH-type transcriptional regulator / antitoxin MqsA